jgi:surface antigen
MATAVSLVGLAAPSYADDDYPYRGLGQCPLVPLPPRAPNTKPGKPGKPGHPSKPGPHPTGSQPGTTATPNGPTGAPTDPPRACAKHIWYYNGTYGDPWGFALRNCTSFVAWRLRNTNGLTDFSNYVDGGAFGNADQWDDNARALGYLVDDIPAVGAVAQTDTGRVGHVAWVSAVGAGTVTVEEYNYYVPGGYDTRTVPTSDFRYLHLADVSPDPGLGSTRAAATTAAAGGGTWTARITPRGDLTLRPASGHAVRLGAPGVWSTHAAPSVAPDTLGRTWVAGVSANGRVLTAHTRGDSHLWTHPHAVPGGPWSTTSTPTLALDGLGRVQLLSVSASGDLVERHTVGVRTDRWTRGDRMGTPGSWSTFTAPAAATDARGRLWVAVTTRGGTLEVVHTQPGARGWSHFRAVDGRTWSATSSPALALANDGRLWLTAVTARGELFVRHTEAGGSRWRPAQQAAGVWSPYSSPATTVDEAGRLWLAGVRTDGSVRVSSMAADTSRWQPEGERPSSPVTASPSFLAGTRGVRVGTVTAVGRPVWGPTAAPRAAVPVDTIARPRGFAAVLTMILHL